MGIQGAPNSTGQDEIRVVKKGTRKCSACKSKSVIHSIPSGRQRRLWKEAGRKLSFEGQLRI